MRRKQKESCYNNVMPKIILIDGNSLAYRAFYALPDTMKTTSGLTTNAVYGFTTMLLKVLEEKPDYIAIAFDLPQPTFRHIEYKEYKATRDKAPTTLREQMPYVKEIAKGFDIQIFELPGFEGDDVIGTLAKEAEKQGLNVEILSGDLDPLQLVSDKIKVLTLRKGLTDTMLYGEKEVEERYGLKPKQLIDYKALKGDTSDNIPGVPKVGEKTAVELLQQYQDLDNIYANLENITKKALKENLKNNRPLADLSKKLGTIVTNAPIDLDLSKCKAKDIDWNKIIPVFEKFEFDRLVKKYSTSISQDKAQEMINQKRDKLSGFNFQLIATPEQLEQFIIELKKHDSFVFDVETTGLDVFTAELIGISFSFARETAYYLPFDHKDHKAKTLLLDVFSSNQLKIGHNLKYDLAILKNHGIEASGPFFDTMIASYLLDPIGQGHGLKKLAKQFLGRDMLKLNEIAGNTQEMNFANVPIDIAKDYACSDAESTYGLYEIFKLALEKQKMDKLFYEIEMPLMEIIMDMELNGIAIDLKFLDKMSKDIDKQLKELETHIYAISGEVFNINSTKQLARILFTKLMLPVLKKNKTGPSTDASVLEELADKDFEIAKRLTNYRQLTKLKNTYIDVLPTLINPKTHRIHTSFNQTITATGRLSSSNPNMQNIPMELRPAFISNSKDTVLIAADYSQIELRILAHLSQDQNLIKYFEQDLDIHQATADELGISRSAAKAVNFGIVYGISDFGLSQQLKIKRTQAQDYIDKYFLKHSGVKLFMDKTIKDAHENEYVTTLLGRKRPLPEINSPNHGLRSFAERTAINTPVQGTAADLIKLAMVDIKSKACGERSRAIKSQSSKLLLQVHDELVFECPKKEAEEAMAMIKDCMENALKLIVPIKVSIHQGVNWQAAK